MRDTWIEVIRHAEAAFWEAIASGTPEAETGDLSPDVAATFTKACEDAAIAWHRANVPSFDVNAFGRAVEEIVDYKGWTASWEFPGYLAFRKEGTEFEIYCTPDHDGRIGMISFEVEDPCDGTRYPGSDNIPDADWPLKGRTVDSFMAIVGPVLDSWTELLLAPKVAHCTIRVLMRAPKKLERGWWVSAKTPEEAVVEIFRESEEWGWIADRDYADDEVDENGMRAVTIQVVKP